MSGSNGSGRLPTLKSAAASNSGLKFKPKAAARRSKEEREASAPKLEEDESQRSTNDRKKFNLRRTTGTGNQNRRMARYLNNTHVVSTGPLAAGNFVGDKGGPERAFARGGGHGASSLVLQGLKNLGGNEGDADDDDDDDGEEEGGVEEGDEEKKKPSQNRFNMGREFSVHDLNGDEDEEEVDSPDMDEEAWRAMKAEELFPIRPIRYRHQDLELLQSAKQEASSSDYTTREPTPAISLVKAEPHDDRTELLEAAEQDGNELHKKLDQLTLQQKFQSLDQAESLAELKSLNEDHERIWKKFNKINNKPNRFVLFQLPSKLPEFEQVNPEPESVAEATVDVKEEKGNEEESGQKEQEKGKKDSEQSASEPIPLTGRIGSIRVHKSGRLSAKIGNVVMDISRGTEASFLQDAVTINQNSDAPPFAELLGRVDGRVVVTPRF